MVSIYFQDMEAILFTALVLALLNKTIRPILKVLAFPITFMTLGIFSIVINTVILMLAFSIAGSYVSGFGGAFLASILLSVLNSVIGSLLGVKQ